MEIQVSQGDNQGYKTHHNFPQDTKSDDKPCNSQYWQDIKLLYDQSRDINHNDYKSSFEWRIIGLQKESEIAVWKVL